METGGSAGVRLVGTDRAQGAIGIADRVGVGARRAGDAGGCSRVRLVEADRTGRAGRAGIVRTGRTLVAADAAWCGDLPDRAGKALGAPGVRLVRICRAGVA